ncbi:RNA polymerase recycling motor HelD [Alicyclobacillus sp.]|uniref:RNA polymerase recycling motor HelD n=1 Tax=Alicyclobacillus sp. TaxID=61169 RepID=UPI0025BF4D28|nr:RNA polymerase recycling motor HelD [Alicyclobacillus sp.]MCL6517920.1 UvrD-helicase domain-containing protein [Alicyclobacillus sp.]
MSVPEQEWQSEQRRVDDVVGQIRRRAAALEAQVGDVREDVVELRRNFWDEVTINLSSLDDLVETHFSIRQQAEVLADRERLHQQAARELKTLRKLADSPYFGRIDFREAGAAGTERIYIGIGSFKADDDTFLVYDWRAPIASLYYDHTPGPVSYEAPMGVITGTMDLKRQFVIHDGVIRLLFDASVTIGDEMLMEVLSRRSDSHMRNIVATIQREQNRIIRHDRGRLLVVQGAAGSGKTSAALQRVAYLLYKYRKTLTTDEMLLFSPNPLFSSYVSTVLPELGEDNIRQATFYEYLVHRLGRQFEVEHPYDQLEYLLTEEGTREHAVRRAGVRFKGSTDFLDLLEAYQAYLLKEGMAFRPIRLEDRVIVPAQEMRRQFYLPEAPRRLADRLEWLRDWLLARVDEFAEAEWRAEWVEREVETLDDAEYRKVQQQMRQSPFSNGGDDEDRQREILARMVLKRYLKPVRARIRRFLFTQPALLYRRLFEDPELAGRLIGRDRLPPEWPEICEQTLARLEARTLWYEDATPFLYLREALQGVHMNTTVRHVLVDEAQDYSPFQLTFLKRLFPRARMTLLGDLNQTISPYGGALGDERTLLRLYGAQETEVIRLTRSYRSTREIVTFTRGMVPGGETIEPFERPGDLPQVVEVSDRETLFNAVVRAVDELRRKGCETIAVICKTAAESREVHAALGPKLGAVLVDAFTLEFTPGVLVMPSYLAKGVEFDGVIVHDASARVYGRESDRSLLYTVCTRAMHHLWIGSVGTPSPFILEQPKETFEWIRPGVQAEA